MIRAVLYAFLLVLWILIWVLPVSLAHFLKKKQIRNRFLRMVNRGILRIANIHVTQTGEIVSDRPLLLVSNHISYLDIPLIASVTDARFTPKAEIAKWPFIGYFCKLFDCIFIERRAGHITRGHTSLGEALQEGSVVSLFPEATTGSGIHLLPFKPAFFELAVTTEGRDGVIVQPLAIKYKKLSGLPISTTQWPLIAWYGDMQLMPHLIGILNLGRLDVELHFLPPISGNDRKILAQQARDAIDAVISG